MSTLIKKLVPNRTICLPEKQLVLAKWKKDSARR